MNSAAPEVGGAVEVPESSPAETWKTGSSRAEARRAALIEWLLLPESERQPRTKQAFAEQWGVTTQTLRDDQTHPTVYSQLARRQRGAAKVEKVGPILDALYRQASDPENPRAVQAAKVFLDYVSKAEEAEAAVDLSELSDADLINSVMKFLERRDG